jgi:hypothetical protein
MRHPRELPADDRQILLDVAPRILVRRTLPWPELQKETNARFVAIAKWGKGELS